MDVRTATESESGPGSESFTVVTGHNRDGALRGRLTVVTVRQQYESVVAREVGEVLGVECNQRQAVSDAACGDPHVVLRPRSSARFGPPPPIVPTCGRSLRHTGSQGALRSTHPAAIWVTAAANLGPFPQL